ncbi:MAG: hypothetical protein ABI417_08790 [Coleofasciculaceae cyanobacterium]
MSSSRGSLGTLEAISAGGAVIGSVIAYFTKEAIFGLAPVSLSLVLNLINRRRLEAFLDQNSDVTTEVQQLKRDVTLLGTTNEKVNQDLQNLAQQQQELTPGIARIEELHQQQEGLRLSLVPLQSRLDDLIQQFNNRSELQQIASLSGVIEALKQSIDQLPPPTEVNNLRKSIDLLSYQFDSRPELAKIENLSVMTEALQQSIEVFSVYNQTPLAREFQEQVAASMKQLTDNAQQVERLKQAIILLDYQFERKISQLEQESLVQT